MDSELEHIIQEIKKEMAPSDLKSFLRSFNENPDDVEYKNGFNEAIDTIIKSREYMENHCGVDTLLCRIVVNELDDGTLLMGAENVNIATVFDKTIHYFTYKPLYHISF